MEYRDKIIFDIAKAECQRIAGLVITELESMTEGMQSGDDTPLANIWDEICVQAQREESVMWEAYLDVIRHVIVDGIKEVPVYIKQSIWLQVDDGMDWDCSDCSETEACPYDDDEIAIYIMNGYVLPKAADHTNARIEQFLYPESDLIIDESDPAPLGDKTFGCQLCANENAISAWSHQREVIASLIEKSHFGLDITACPDCGQKYLDIFTETFDWVEGNDSLYRDLLPITEEEADHILNDDNGVSLKYIEGIGTDRRYLKSDIFGRRWADGGLHVQEGH